MKKIINLVFSLVYLSTISCADNSIANDTTNLIVDKEQVMGIWELYETYEIYRNAETSQILREFSTFQYDKDNDSVVIKITADSTYMDIYHTNKYDTTYNKPITFNDDNTITAENATWNVYITGNIMKWEMFYQSKIGDKVSKEIRDITIYYKKIEE